MKCFGGNLPCFSASLWVILEKNYSALISKLGPGAAGTRDVWVMGSEVGQGQNWKRTNTYVTSLNWVLKIMKSMTVREVGLLIVVGLIE